MREYLFSDLKTIEVINIDHHQVNINGITILDIDELRFHEIDHETITMRFLTQKKEIASMEIQQDEKLICDENSNFIIVPVEGMDF